MNKVYSIATLALGLFVMGLSGCAQKEDNVFDRSVSERVEEEVQKFNKLLISSPEGWILEYIPGGTQQYGGYYIGLKFSEKGEALATNDLLVDNGSGLWHKSQYIVGKDKSVSINFDTYNEGIHYFTTPDKTYAGGISLGFEGDHEFTLVQIVSDNEVLVRGKKTRNLMTLRRATGSIDDFMASIRAMRAKIFNTKEMNRLHQDALVGNLGSKEQIAKLDKGGLNVYNVTTTGEDGTKIRSYFVTPTGIRFVNPVEGVTEMTWDESSSQLKSGSQTLTARRDPTRDQYEAFLGEYTLAVEGASYNVRFEEGEYNVYNITGLPFTIKANFNSERNRFEIMYQELQTLPDGNKVALCMWSLTPDNLSWNSALGMYSSLVKDSNPKSYTMNDNGQWSGYKATSFILWIIKPGGAGHAGIYDGYNAQGITPYFRKPVFTRRN